MNNNLFILLSSLILMCELATCSTPTTHHHHRVEWGAHGSRDILLKREHVREKAKLLQVRSQIYEFRQKLDHLIAPRTITKIAIEDQYNNENGGIATLKEGGPGLDYAIIQLKSQRGHGFDFIIDIYGM